MRHLAVALLAALLAGCPSPTAGIYPYPGALSSPAATGLAGLIGSAGSSTDDAVRNTLVRPTALTFPTRIAVIAYNYNSALKPEDRQAAMNTLRDQLLGSKLVREVFQVPESLASSASTLDGMRGLAARFQSDVLLVLSGSGGVKAADATAPTSFFDTFSSKATYAGSATIEGLAVDVVTGIFIGSFKTAGASDPKQVDTGNAATFAGAVYPLAQTAETKALASANTRLIDALTALKTANEAAH